MKNVILSINLSLLIALTVSLPGFAYKMIILETALSPRHTRYDLQFISQNGRSCSGFQINEYEAKTGQFGVLTRDTIRDMQASYDKKESNEDIPGTPIQWIHKQAYVDNPYAPGPVPAPVSIPAPNLTPTELAALRSKFASYIKQEQERNTFNAAQKEAEMEFRTKYAARIDQRMYELEAMNVARTGVPMKPGYDSHFGTIARDEVRSEVQREGGYPGLHSH